MSLYKKIIPTYYYETVFQIDFTNLKEQGIKTLFFDLDNTLMSYHEKTLNQDTINFLKQCQRSFNVVIVSNSRRSRVATALEGINIFYVYHAYKPLKGGFKRALKVYGNLKDEVILIGDQLMTDMIGANRFKIKSILVKPIARKSDIWTTRLNRKIEKHFIKQLRKKNITIYNERIKPYESD